jgi:uncharacterized protein YjbJ (UPF0337 family)
MSLGDKISNKAEDLRGKAKETAGNVTGEEQLRAEDLRGKAKETAGNVTGEEQLRAEGKSDQAKAGLKDAVEDVKGAVGDVADKVKNVFKQ